MCVCLSIREHIPARSLPVFVHVAYGCGLVLLRQGDEIPRERGQFWRLSGPFKSIGNLRCSRPCRVGANNVMQQKGSFSMLCQASENRNPENSERRRCGLSAGKAVTGYTERAKSDIYDCLVYRAKGLCEMSTGLPQTAALNTHSVGKVRPLFCYVSETTREWM